MKRTWTTVIGTWALPLSGNKTGTGPATVAPACQLSKRAAEGFQYGHCPCHQKYISNQSMIHYGRGRGSWASCHVLTPKPNSAGWCPIADAAALRALRSRADPAQDGRGVGWGNFPSKLPRNPNDLLRCCRCHVLLEMLRRRAVSQRIQNNESVWNYNCQQSWQLWD